MNPEEERLARWTTCHISGELLQPPVVADRLGNLYNKEAVLQGLLSKTLPPGLEHIHGLKSVTELNLELPSDGDAGRKSQSMTLFWHDYHEGLDVCGRFASEECGCAL